MAPMGIKSAHRCTVTAAPCNSAEALGKAAQEMQACSAAVQGLRPVQARACTVVVHAWPWPITQTTALLLRVPQKAQYDWDGRLPQAGAAGSGDVGQASIVDREAPRSSGLHQALPAAASARPTSSRLLPATDCSCLLAGQVAAFTAARVPPARSGSCAQSRVTTWKHLPTRLPTGAALLQACSVVKMPCERVQCCAVGAGPCVCTQHAKRSH